MGLITEEVEVRLSPSNIKYYRSLGYITNDKLSKEKWGSILVKTKDLQPFSCVKVIVQCDDCQEIREITYSTYTRINKNGKTYCHACISKRMRGENSPHWKSEISKEERDNYRGIDGYLDFIKTVLMRDNYVCQCCGTHVSGGLNVHHLNGYNWFIAGRVDPQNAITLCKNCHNNFHSIYGKGNNTKEQFEEWLGKTLPKFKDHNIVLPKAKQIYCIENNTVYNNAVEAAKELNTYHTLIYNICNKKVCCKDGKEYVCKSANGYHFLYYEEYLNMLQNNENIDSYISKHNNTKEVICLTTMKVFKSIKAAQEFYGAGDIGSCCKGRIKTTGKLSDGTRLKWMYYDDYLKSWDDSSNNQVTS